MRTVDSCESSVDGGRRGECLNFWVRSTPPQAAERQKCEPECVSCDGPATGHLRLAAVGVWAIKASGLTQRLGILYGDTGT